MTGRHLLEGMGWLATIGPALAPGPRLGVGLVCMFGLLVLCASVLARACGAK